jgi:hypothetical protein
VDEPSTAFGVRNLSQKEFEARGTGFEGWFVPILLAEPAGEVRWL